MERVTPTKTSVISIGFIIVHVAKFPKYNFIKILTIASAFHFHVSNTLYYDFLAKLRTWTGKKAYVFRWTILSFFCSSRAFEGLLQVIELNLSKNNISMIPTDAFSSLVSLRDLDLSFNNLKKLGNRTNGVLEPCLSLERVSYK